MRSVFPFIYFVSTNSGHKNCYTEISIEPNILLSSLQCEVTFKIFYLFHIHLKAATGGN